MLPLTRKATPPNIFFSTRPDRPLSSFRTSPTRASLNAIQTSTLPQSPGDSRLPLAGLSQLLVEDDRVMRGSVRIEGISWDRPRGGPSHLPIQVLRPASRPASGG